MADKKPKASSVITLGGNGSSLSAASFFAVANGLAQVRIDSSILDKLKSSSSNRKSPPVKFHIPIPKILTFEESRAFLLALLNKLLLSGSASTVLPVLISDVLNAGSKNLDLGEVEVSAEEVGILDKSCACLYGICGILDYESSALSTIADVVAAMSSEASKADVGALNLMDSGDGLSVKDEVGVASDLKVLLNGSKLVGKVEVDAVPEIPKIHGSLREVVVKAVSLRCLGESSFSRAKMNLNSIGSHNLRSTLVELFEGKCSVLKAGAVSAFLNFWMGRHMGLQ